MNSQSQQVYSNSVINISSQQSQIDNYTVAWCRKLIKNGQNESWIVKRTRSYMCSPLDVDYYIEACIQVSNLITKQENKPVQIKLYGPVTLQPNLIDVEPSKCFQIKTILNKNMPYSGAFDLRDLPKIILKLQNKDMVFDYNYFFEDCWNKLSCPAEQPSSIIINIKLIKKEFLQYLKQLKIFMHIGDTIKITFINNFEKNLFLLQLVKYMKVNKAKKKRIVNLPSFEMQKPQQFHEKFDIPILESQEGEVNCDTKILDDLYDVIYTPTAKKGPKLFPNPQHQNKLNKNDGFIHKNKEKKDNKVIRGTTKQINGAYYLDECKKQRFYSQRDEQSSYLHNNNEQAKNIRPVQQHIIKMNNFLMSENQRLRKQNELLKQDKQKLQSALNERNNDKISELKSYLEIIQGQMNKLTDEVCLKTGSNTNAVIKKYADSPIDLNHHNSKKNLPVFLRKLQKNADTETFKTKNDQNNRLYTNPDLNQRISTGSNSKPTINEKYNSVKLNLTQQEHK